jgi:hypothetical protein
VQAVGFVDYIPEVSKQHKAWDKYGSMAMSACFIAPKHLNQSSRTACSGFAALDSSRHTPTCRFSMTLPWGPLVIDGSTCWTARGWTSTTHHHHQHVSWAMDSTQTARSGL